MTKEQIEQLKEFAFELRNNRDYYSRAKIIEMMVDKVKKLNEPAVIKSAFKCDDVELQPIECEKWRGCFDCPHYKAVL